MTDEQFYLARDMQDLLVKYLNTIEDPLEEIRISQEWKRFINRCGWDSERLSYTASGTMIIGNAWLIGFKEGFKESLTKKD